MRRSKAIRYRITTRRGVTRGMCVIPCKGRRPMVLRASIPLKKVDRALRASYRMHGRDDELGWGFLKKLAKSVKKIAKRVVKNKLTAAVAGIANSKYMKFVPEPYRSGIKTAVAVTNIASRALGGDRKAKAIMKRARTAAAYKNRPTRRRRNRYIAAKAAGRKLVGAPGSQPFKVTAPSGRVYRTLVSLSR